MDNWGDPWADHAHSEPPQKEEEVKPPPPLSTAPVILNGFLDDAGWGSVDKDDGFGGWAASPAIAAPSISSDREGAPTEYEAEKGIVSREGTYSHSEGWGDSFEEQETAGHSDNVASEQSDSATTIQADEGSRKSSADLAVTVQVEDDASTRPSTSPSDVSHTETHAESPRTSFEDERASGKAQEARVYSPISETPGIKAPEVAKSTPNHTLAENVEVSIEADDEFGEFEDDEGSVEPIPEVEGFSANIPPAATSRETETGDHGERHRTAVSESDQLFQPDLSLVEGIFPVADPKSEPGACPDDPISTTSQRKAWYRLTRKQTMREFNSGNDDDGYVRVTWTDSHIRTRVNDIVKKWATEDRMSFRGQSASGNFFWDQPATKPDFNPFEKKHRKRPSLPFSAQVAPAIQAARPEPFAGAATAHFNWSSSPVSSAHEDRAGASSPNPRAVSSPVAPKHIAAERVQGHGKRSTSFEMTGKAFGDRTHKRTSTVPNAASPQSSLPIEPPRISLGGGINSFSSIMIPPPGSATPSTTAKVSLDTDPWQDLDSFESIAPPVESEGKPSLAVDTGTPLPVGADDDDDDEWGEMVESPSVGEFAKQLPEQPRATLPIVKAEPTAPATPRATKPLAVDAPVLKHSSPLVRLKGTVSPTSANFRFNSFLPATTEVEPIGRAILRPSPKSTPEKVTAVPQATHPIGDPVKKTLETPVQDSDFSDDLSAFVSAASTLPSSPAKESPMMQISVEPLPTSSLPMSTTGTPPPASSAPAPTQAAVDSLFDADFSIFESQHLPQAPPTTANHPDPSDPFSIFETALPAPNSIPSPTPPSFATPPPQAEAVAAKPLLTGVTNTAQKRKDEDDEIIRNIIAGLPDLSYMLRC